jgi:hypothetical protein
LSYQLNLFSVFGHIHMGLYGENADNRILAWFIRISFSQICHNRYDRQAHARKIKPSENPKGPKKQQLSPTLRCMWGCVHDSGR